MNTIFKWKDFIGAGWYTIVEESVSKIEAHGGFITQIKEKFGGLRIYVQGGDADAIDDIVRAAELQAKHTCEECGLPGVVHNKNGVYKTYCAKHAKA